MSSDAHFSKTEIENLFTTFTKIHLLVVGDLILDNYIWGAVDRISPEAPVPVLSVEKKESRQGGAGNVAANLAKLGSKVTIAGVLGADKEGEILTKLFEQNGIKHILVNTHQRRTTVKSRVIAQHQQLLRIDEEIVDEIEYEITQPILERISISSSKYDGVILSDYAKGLLSTEFIHKILNTFKDKPVVVDPKGYDYKKYRGATAIKPNIKEFRTALHKPELKKEDLKTFATKTVEDFELEGLIITMGEDGVFVLDKNGKSLIIPTRAKEVYDVSGAGDTFIAAFTAGLILTDDWFLAAQAGNIASGVVVAKVGTATTSLEEILNHNK